jgi:hypothetical protein
MQTMKEVPVSTQNRDSSNGKFSIIGHKLIKTQQQR